MRYKNKSSKLPNPIKYSLWLLGYKGRSVKDMTAALEKRGFDEAVVADTVATLLDWGYLNDARLKEDLIDRRKRNNVKGRSFLRRELEQAGIYDLDDLDQLYTDEEEQEAILTLLEKWGRTTLLCEDNRGKYFMRLANRGFSKGNIFTAMEKHCDDKERLS